MSKIMSINAGSSSLKFQIIDMPSERVITKGVIERIGLKDSVFNILVNDQNEKIISDIKNHNEAVSILLEALVRNNIVASLDEIDGVGHRVVHGGEKFVDSAVITEDVIEHIEAVSDLAPLHNPANLVGIAAFKEALPNICTVAIFDTAFHQSMPREAYIYPTPYEWYENYGVRRYGFHGTSHKYVSLKAAEILNKKPEEVNVITAHIGNGVSLCAVKGGKSVDTTMGLTPLAGIAMGTRSGDIDPAIIEFIADKEERSIKGVIKKLNNESGLLGISGVSSDARDIRKGIEEGDERCLLAFNIQVKTIASYVASYHTYMEGADALVLTAGIGEHSSLVRKAICDRLGALGLKIDYKVNDQIDDEGIISTKDSTIKVIVIPTNEELMMARDVYRLMNE